MSSDLQKMQAKAENQISIFNQSQIFLEGECTKMSKQNEDLRRHIKYIIQVIEQERVK